ncbi:hypothetical protein BT96DRAFT_1007089 [Gymnopus androsaceus JB14]|uniref:Uncharacterized protein n=1 Tax=Gymnopus androsaceus JB14 TaxID=1447944 RepID=A0A6A4GIR2_9AGAR|nr:hypothetical protein BT96DRAFT_1007089 [Gymnopus androsaceus JB14]
MCFTSTSYGYETHPYPAREPSRLAATASLTGSVGDTVCRGCSYTRMCFTSTSISCRRPSRLAVTASLTGGVGDTVCRDALIHGCVLHPHPTDMKHIRILPEAKSSGSDRLPHRRRW